MSVSRYRKITASDNILLSLAAYPNYLGNVGAYQGDQYMYSDYPQYNYVGGPSPYGKLDYNEAIAPPYDYQEQLRKPEAKSYFPPKSEPTYVPVVVKKKKKKRT